MKGADLVDLGNQALLAHQVADAHAGQAEFAHGAHHQHMGVLGQQAHRIALGKGLVGLVHHHQAAHRARGLHQALDHGGVPEIAGGVVRVGQIDQRRPLLRYGGQHGGLVQLEVGREWHTHEVQALVARRDAVHHEAGQGREDLRAGAAHRHGQHGDDLVRAIAQGDAAARGHAGMGGQGAGQVLRALGRVAVDGHPSQALAQLLLQRLGQAEGFSMVSSLIRPAALCTA